MTSLNKLSSYTVDARNPAPLLYVNVFRAHPPWPPDLILAVDDVEAQAPLVQDFDHVNSVLQTVIHVQY